MKNSVENHKKFYDSQAGSIGFLRSLLVRNRKRLKIFGEFSEYDHNHGRDTCGIDWFFREKIAGSMRRHRSSERLMLDVGTGPGYTGITIVEKTGCHVHGIDVSKRMVERAIKNAARARVSNKYSAKQGSVMDIPARDATYDGAVWFFGPGAIDPEERVAAFDEIRRVLKPGASIEIADARSPVATGEEFKLTSYLFDIFLKAPLRGAIGTPPVRSINDALGTPDRVYQHAFQHFVQKKLKFWNWQVTDGLAEVLQESGFVDIQVTNYQGVATSLIPGRDYGAPFLWGNLIRANNACP